MSGIILIPARFGSERFPGKLLKKLGDDPLIVWAARKAEETGLISYTVTDNDEIEAAVQSHGFKTIRVNDDVQTGTERIALAWAKVKEKHPEVDYIINIQGDEPFISSELVTHLLHFHRENPHFGLTTVVAPRPWEDESRSLPQRVKALYVSASGQCLYFSRSSLPFVRSSAPPSWFLHLGVYCYDKKLLESFSTLKKGPFEIAENLEQLRVLENGRSIGAISWPHESHGVDTPEDLEILNKGLINGSIK